MSTINDGGPALPIPELSNDSDFNGVSRRDYFAAKAFQAMPTGYYSDNDAVAWADVDVCTAAYRYADAMLKASGK